MPAPAKHQPPELDGFKFRPVIDWIEVELTLQQPSQWHHLKRRMPAAWGVGYVESLDAPESSKRFRFRVQNPSTADAFMRQLQELQRDGETLTEDAIRISGIEIANDAMHPSHDHDRLARACAYMMKHHANLPNGSPRITIPAYFDSPILQAEHERAVTAHADQVAAAHQNGAEPPAPLERPLGSRSAVGSPDEALKAFQSGLSINQGRAPNKHTGDRGDSYRLRWYVKTKDTRDGQAYATLPQDEHVARAEATLIDQALDDLRLKPKNDGMPLRLRTIHDWRHFRFETLSTRFGLVMPKQTLSDLQRQSLARAVQFGQPLVKLDLAATPGTVAKSAHPGYRRTKARCVRANSGVNERIRVGLKVLTKRITRKNSELTLSTTTAVTEGDCATGSVSPEYYVGNTKNGLKPYREVCRALIRKRGGKPERNSDRQVSEARKSKSCQNRRLVKIYHVKNLILINHTWRLKISPKQCGPPMRNILTIMFCLQSYQIG